MQAVGQLALEPLQTKVPQEGAPPVVTFAQVPLVVAPAATEQALQLPVHALSQQKPSTQLPVPHWLFAVHAVP